MSGSEKFSVVSGGASPLPANWRSLLAVLPEDLRDAYEERAALIEYDGDEKRKTAERRAFECVTQGNEAAQQAFAAYLARTEAAGLLHKDKRRSRPH